MLKPAKPANEADRLAALYALGVLDTSPEERIDRITRLARGSLDVPIALVSLVDENRQWFKSRQGLDISETPRDLSFCAHAILQGDLLIVPDALQDSRFHDNPYVIGDPHIRFYAGMPITLSSGFTVGTLCIMDRRPRHLDHQQVSILYDLGRCVIGELENQSTLSYLRTIRDQEQQLRAVLNGVSEAIILVTDTDMIQAANPAASNLFGLDAGQFIGRQVTSVLPAVGKLHWQSRTRAERQHTRGLAADGSEFDVEVSIQRSTVNEHPMQVMVIQDITERLKVERMKAEFVSTVSHELRTPLTSIRGALDLVLDRFHGQMPEKAVMMLHTAKRNSERLTLLINDILNLEKLETSSTPLDMEELDIVTLTEQAISANESYAHKYQIRLVLQDAPLLAWVHGDEHRLFQVYANLLSNAIKYSPAGGSVEISIDSDVDRVTVSVRDHGPGISDAFRDKIFQRFAQADSSDTRKRGGTGLGLSITRSIIERHHGTIGFRPAEGGGTVFHFSLPVKNLLEKVQHDRSD
ncbi:MAG: PAS domain S-box protein [Alcanivoracaceae bacterium]|jgi:PAS domain S-box-containing protein|nr:PAS domain S-box protein [Alcanivoracaceae bacterium]